jgi:hypothetical protein
MHLLARKFVRTVHRRFVTVALFALCLSIVPRVASADAVYDWSLIAYNAMFVNTTPPVGGSASAINYAYLHAAIYDAVNAIDGHYSVFAVPARPGTVTLGASIDAATAAAGYTILRFLFPTQAGPTGYLTTTYNNYLLGIPNGPAKDHGVTLGTEIATDFLTSRVGDGRNATVPYTFGPVEPGVYQLTPGAAAPPATPATPWVAVMRPFAINSPSQFRADGPPNLTSAQWAEDYNEVKAYGGDAATGSLRTQEQTAIGWFYTDVPGAYGNRVIRDLAADQHLSGAESARFFAQTYVTIADTFIGCWDSKFYYNFWRPVTAIRAGDTDNNDATEGLPSWTPLATTPNHPEYPSAHGCFTGAMANSIEHFFGTKKLTIRLTSLSVRKPDGTIGPPVTHTFTKTQDMLKEVIEGRIFGGMHYRTSVVHGIVLSNKVAHWVAKHYFLPVD